MKYAAKYIHRSFTTLIALMSLVSLLVTQMAVAAHPCPVMMAVAHTAQVDPANEAAVADVDDLALMPSCQSPCGSQDRSALCQQHCTADHRIVGDADFRAPIQFIPAYEITLAAATVIARDGPAAFTFIATVDLHHPTNPPPILAFGQLRI